MANICLIDDEKALNQVLKIYLERDGHSVVPYYCIQDIYKRTNWYSLYDLYIIDIMLPDGSGTELLKKIKDKNKNIPVVLISARGECIDRVLGFEMGCDDYLAKPFYRQNFVIVFLICLKAIICPPKNSLNLTVITLISPNEKSTLNNRFKYLLPARNLILSFIF